MAKITRSITTMNPSIKEKLKVVHEERKPILDKVVLVKGSSSAGAASTTGEKNSGSTIQVSYVSVGRGYNLLESPYINPKSTIATNNIINIDAKDVVDHPLDKFYDFEIITESSVSEVYKKFNKDKKTGFLGLFSGLASKEFLQTADYEERAYTKMYAYCVKKRQTIDINPKSENRLTNQFVTDLNGSMAPETLFKKYGTHLIKEVFLGGRFELDYTTEKEAKDTTEDIRKKAGGFCSFLGGTCTEEEETSAREFYAKSKLHVQIVGGTSISTTGLEKIKEGYQPWLDSLKEPENCAPCGIPSYDSLVPIWDFCKNETPSEKIRYAQIKKTFDNLAAKIVLSEDYYITGIQVVSDSKRDRAISRCNIESGYQRIDVDLNEGAKSSLKPFKEKHYIYLCIKREKCETQTLRNKRITNIMCHSFKESKNKWEGDITHIDGKTARYIRDDNDLNKGVQGKYLYLVYTKDTKYDPIKNIAVCFGAERPSTEWNGRVCYVKTSETADMNQGAGGKFISIWFKR